MVIRESRLYITRRQTDEYEDYLERCDELNLRLLEHDSVDVFSRKADSGYKVCFNF